MICFPNAKINIGLHITEKRNDEYHNIETIFYPVVGFYDCLEFLESNELKFENEGLQIDSPIENNLCIKAWKVFKSHFDIPPIHIILQKNIPFGGGLGGGSADAAFLLSALNSFFSVNASTSEIEKMALEIGSDCPFFVQNKTVFAEGRGEIFTEANISLKDYWLVLAKPNVNVNTANAYKGIIPFKRDKKLIDMIPRNVENWKNAIENDFEVNVFKEHPQIQAIKETMYNMGAVYASMSGSGATVYGLFEKKIDIPNNIPVIWAGKLK